MRSGVTTAGLELLRNAHLLRSANSRRGAGHPMNPIRHAARRLVPALAITTMGAIAGGVPASQTARAATKRPQERRLEEPMRDPQTGDAARHALASTPMRFAENRGQAPADVAFVGEGAGASVLVTESGAHVTIGSAEIALRTEPAA